MRPRMVTGTNDERIAPTPPLRELQLPVDARLVPAAVEVVETAGDVRPHNPVLTVRLRNTSGVKIVSPITACELYRPIVAILKKLNNSREMQPHDNICSLKLHLRRASVNKKYL